MMKHPVIRRSNIAYIVIICFTTRGLFGSSLRFLRTILLCFFISQFRSKITKKPAVVNVNHPLDKTIPFRPETVKTYLSFIHLYVSALSYIRKTYGKKVDGEIGRFIDDLSTAYREALTVYNTRLSTTKRPKGYINRHFILIHLFDPHLYCIPSLHVIIVCYTYLRIREICETFGSDYKISKQVDCLYEEALRIMEAILYIRQHSVNCIAAGLYMGTGLFSVFTKEESLRFIRALFEEDEPLVPNRKEIINYIEALYLSFLEKRGKHNDFKDVLKDFLISYDAKPNQELSGNRNKPFSR